MERWYVYILSCSDSTLYTGIARDIARRLEEHNTSPKAARYTRARRPVTLVYSEELESRSAALVREAHIKRLRRDQKETLIAQGKKGIA